VNLSVLAFGYLLLILDYASACLLCNVFSFASGSEIKEVSSSSSCLLPLLKSYNLYERISSLDAPPRLFEVLVFSISSI